MLNIDIRVSIEQSSNIKELRCIIKVLFTYFFGLKCVPQMLSLFFFLSLFDLYFYLFFRFLLDYIH